MKITKTRVKGKIVLTCEVYPSGIGHLTWRHEGYRVKYDKLVATLELENPSGGEYECYGNLTLGGFKYFTSRAYATGRSGFLYLVDVCLFDLTYGTSRCNATQHKTVQLSSAQYRYTIRPVAKPARHLVMQMHFFCVCKPYKESISKELNNDNDLNLHDQIVGECSVLHI